jgi:hypothetical protein
MTEKTAELKAAEWLICGFVKNWSFQMLEITMCQSIGFRPDVGFLPDRFSNFVGSSPVRGYVYANWPKLGAFLETALPEKQMKAAHQVLKLKWNGNLASGALDKDERRDIAKTKRDLRQATTSYRESRKEFKNSRGTNWSQCK